MHEQRLIVRLQNYWDILRKDAQMPPIVKLNSGAIADMWAQSLLLLLEKQAGALAHYRYEHVGEEISRLFGEDRQGRAVNLKMVEFPGLQVAKFIQKAVAEAAPQVDENQFVSKDGRLVKYRCCFLPFGDDKRGITHILVGISHRIF